MPKGPQGQKRPADSIARAVMIAKIATGEERESLKGKSTGAQSAGGKARAAALDEDRRSEIARNAAEERWKND